MLDNDGFQLETLTLDLFKDLQNPLLSFYRAQLVRNQLLNYEVELFNVFSDLAQTIRELSETPWWQLLQSHVSAQEGRKLLTTIHTRLVEYGTQAFTLNRERSDSLEKIKQHWLLSKIHRYFGRMTDVEMEVPQYFSAALDHFEKELHSFGIVRAVLIASLLGAAVGALLTVALK